jgi:hypothetical protein
MWARRARGTSPTRRSPSPTAGVAAALDLVLQYTATGGSPCTRHLAIESHDPDHPKVIIDVSASTKMTLNGGLRGWLASSLHSLLATVSTPPVVVFTITSKTINPSAAYTVLGSNRIRTVATGTDPHKSFSDVQFDEARWGDYSFAQVDPSGLGIWLATEYIPPAADQDPLDNWGTYVFKVNQFSLGH